MKSSAKIQKRHKGFTLMELMVVVTIIALLAAIGFLGSQRLINSANQTKSIAQVRQLGSAVQIFASENNGAVLDWSGTVVNGNKRNWSHHLLVSLQSDLGDDDRYLKPVGDSAARAIGIFSDPKALKEGKAKLPKTGHNSWRTYAYNNRIGTYTPESAEPIPYKQGAKFVHEVESPNRLILFSQRVLSGTQYFAFLQPEDASNDNLAFPLYKGKVPVGYFDGHAEMLTKKNYPTQVGKGINPATGKAFTESDWREAWWGRLTQTTPL